MLRTRVTSCTGQRARNGVPASGAGRPPGSCPRPGDGQMTVEGTVVRRLTEAPGDGDDRRGQPVETRHRDVQHPSTEAVHGRSGRGDHRLPPILGHRERRGERPATSGSSPSVIEPRNRSVTCHCSGEVQRRPATSGRRRPATCADTSAGGHTATKCRIEEGSIGAMDATPGAMDAAPHVRRIGREPAMVAAALGLFEQALGRWGSTAMPV